jgi:hypothetical protein
MEQETGLTGAGTGAGTGNVQRRVPPTSSE